MPVAGCRSSSSDLSSFVTCSGSALRGFVSRRPTQSASTDSTPCVPARICELSLRRPTPTSADSSGVRSPRATSADSSWVWSWRRGGVLLDPQRTARASPTDSPHPRGRRRRRRCRVGDRGSALPSRKVRPRAARVDVRWRAEVLAEVEQHVNHADPHLPRRGQRAGVKAVADHLPFAPERAVDGERQPNGQPVHAPTGAAGLVALDDEVAVVLLDRKVDHPEPVDRRPSDGAPERPEHARRAERRQSGRTTDGDLHRVSGIDLRSRVVGHRSTAARLSPGALASAPPRACHPEGQLQLPPSCRLDSAHVPLSAWTAEGCVVKGRTTAATAARGADLIPRMFCCRRRTPTGWARRAADGAVLFTRMVVPPKMWPIVRPVA